MYTDQFNHAPAQLFLHTGSPRQGRPEHGLVGHLRPGQRERRICPASSCSSPAAKRPTAARRCGAAGFLPTVYQGVQCRSQGEPVLYVSNPPGMDAQTRRRSLDALEGRSTRCSLQKVGDPETRHAHRAVRAGLPDADERAGGDGHRQGAEVRPRDVRHGAGQGFLREQLPARAAACSSAACASCSCSTGAGTSTATARTTTFVDGLVRQTQADRPGLRRA